MLRGDALSRKNILRCETIWSRVTFEAAIVLRANDITRLTRLIFGGFVLDTGTSWLYADSTEGFESVQGLQIRREGDASDPDVAQNGVGSTLRRTRRAPDVSFVRVHSRVLQPGRNRFVRGRSDPNYQEGVPWRLVVFKFRLFALVVFLLLAMVPAANAQSVTGQISGDRKSVV